MEVMFEDDKYILSCRFAFYGSEDEIKKMDVTISPTTVEVLSVDRS